MRKRQQAASPVTGHVQLGGKAAPAMPKGLRASVGPQPRAGGRVELHLPLMRAGHGLVRGLQGS
ncbi:hypothetical protein [Hymenobacter terrenus]|uniref:hypothetical protein n=1 Tax=Hymenobacter terrenus TaxID=1629124 RepID=UPI0012E03B79